MKTYKITIEIQELEETNINPFLKIGERIEREKQQKLLIYSRNKKIAEVHQDILKKIKTSLLEKLLEAKIVVHYNSVFRKDDVMERNSFNPLYGDLSFWIRVNNKDLLVLMEPNIVEENGHKVLSGEYSTYYSTTSNAAQLKYGNAGGWKSFKETKVLEDELVKFFK